MISSLRARLTLLLLISTLPVALLMLAAATDRRFRALEEISATTSNTLQLVVQNQEQAVTQVRTVLHWLTVLPEVRDSLTGNPAACQTVLKDLLGNTPGFTAFAVAAPNGDVVCSTSAATPASPAPTAPAAPAPGTRLNLADREIFKRATAAGQFVMGNVQVGAVSGQLALAFAYPMLNAQGQLEFMVITGLNILKMNDAAQNLQLPNSTYLIVDERSTIAVRFPNPADWVGKTLEDEPLVQAMLAQKRGTATLIGQDGVERFYSFTPITIDPTTNLYAAVGVSTDEAFADINRVMVRDLVGLGLITLMALALAWWLSETTLLRPIRKIAATAKLLSDGSLTARIQLNSGARELVTLAHALDQTSEILQKREVELRQLNLDLEQRVQERTEQLQASNTQLQGFQRQLRQLATQTNTAIEAERTRIAREVHDELGQTLTGLKMDLAAAKRRLDPGQTRALAKVDSAINLLDQTVYAVRRISAELRPGMLDDLGLVAAMVWHVREFEERTAIACTFTAKVSTETFDQDVATTIFRILQEALTNVARHAQAHKVEIVLEEEGPELKMTVTDDGIGIGKNQAHDVRSLGLMGMNERALRFEGSVEISGTLGKGTQVIARVPLHVPAAAPDATRPMAASPMAASSASSDSDVLQGPG